MAPTLPQIRVSEIDLLNDWDLSNVKAFSDSIPGYRSGASTSMTMDPPSWPSPLIHKDYHTHSTAIFTLSFIEILTNNSIPNDAPLQPSPLSYLPLTLLLPRLHTHHPGLLLHRPLRPSKPLCALDQYSN